MINDAYTQFSKPCGICREDHPPVTCGWIEVLTQIDKFSEEQQKELLEVCPFLDSICDKKSRSIIYACSWTFLYDKVQRASNKIFEFPYERQVEKSTALSIPNDNKVEEVVIKIPQNSEELADYTLQKFTELTCKGLINKPAELRQFCVFCRNSEHHVSICPEIPKKSEQDKKYSYVSCYICCEKHDLMDCKWPQIIDLATSLSALEQLHLLEVCPYLKEPIDNPSRLLYSMFSWVLQRRNVDYMNPQNFILPYCKIDQRDPVEVQTTKANSTETATQRPPEKRVVNKKKEIHGERLCFYCHQSSHIVKNCVLFKERKYRRKGDKLPERFSTQTTQHRSVVCTEKLTKEQFFLTRSSTMGNVSTEDRWNRYLKYSSRDDQRTSLPMNCGKAITNNSAD